MHGDEGVPSRFHFLNCYRNDLSGSNCGLSNRLSIIAEFLKFFLFLLRSQKMIGYVCPFSRGLYETASVTS